MVGKKRVLPGGNHPNKALVGSTCSAVAGYAFAVLSVALLTLILGELNPVFPMGRFPIVLALPVAASAYLFGFGPGLSAYLLASFAFLYFFVSPKGAVWPLQDAVDIWADIAAYCIGCSLLFYAALRVRYARDKVERLARSLAESNEHTSSILESITDSYFALDDQWRFVEINPTAERLIFRRPASELIGKSYWKEYPQAVDSELYHQYHKAVAEQVPVHLEAQSRLAECNWFEAHAYPREGRLEVYLRDITERKRAEHEIRELAQRLESHMQNSPMAVVEWNSDYRITRWSEEAHEVFGWTAGEMQGKRIDEVRWVYEEDWDKVAKLMADMNAGIRPRNVNPNRNYTKDGSVIWCEWYNSVLKDESGEVISVLSLVLDVTDRELAKQESTTAREEAERRAAELETFFGSMGDGVALFDVRGQVVLANDAGRAMLGFPEGEPFEQWTKDYRLFALDGEPIPIEEYTSRRALRGETLSDARYKVTTPWREGLISISASPVKDLGGSVIGAVVVFRDVQKQVEFEQRSVALYQREHHIAEMLQKALIPSEIPADLFGFRIATRYQPALKEAEVGGDFYDLFELGDGKIGVIIGDVAGKGLLAAMRVSAARYTIRSYALHDPSPATVMCQANQALSMEDTPGFTSFVTAFFAVIDAKTRTVTYANAGHEPPVILRSDGRVEELVAGGRAFGITVEDCDYDQAKAELASGDTMILVTDGVTEARTQAVIWGKEGMCDHLSRAGEGSPDSIADGLLQAAVSFAGGGLHDDAAIVVIQIG